MKIELDQQVPDSALALARNPPYGRPSDHEPVERYYSEPGLRLVDGEIPEHRLYQAESFHQLYRKQNAERQSKLRGLYEELGCPDSIVVMMFCRNYLQMFENWLASCDRNGIESRRQLIVFCLDEEAFRRACDLGIKAYFCDPNVYPVSGKSRTFGDEWFRNTILYKNAIIADALELGASVLFQDTDMIWLKDPFEYLDANLDHYDLQIMYDGPNPRGRPVYGNTGFMYLKSNPITRALLETALRNSASILSVGGHQFVFMKIIAFFLHRQMIKVHILPDHMFLNGHLFNLKRGILPPATAWQREGVVVHYSWTGNRDEKLRKLKMFQLSYIDFPQAAEVEGTDGEKPETTGTKDTKDMAESTDQDFFEIRLHMQHSDPVELLCEKSSPVLHSILRSFFQDPQEGGKPAIIHLQLMEDDQMYDLFLRSSQLTRVEITPPLDQDTLGQIVR